MIDIYKGIALLLLATGAVASFYLASPITFFLGLAFLIPFIYISYLVSNDDNDDESSEC